VETLETQTLDKPEPEESEETEETAEMPLEQKQLVETLEAAETAEPVHPQTVVINYPHSVELVVQLVKLALALALVLRTATQVAMVQRAQMVIND
jgi:hypothetical protein